MATYSVYLTDPNGTRIADASNFISLEYSRVVNNWSTLRLELPSQFNTQLIRIPDGRVEVWRRIDSGREYLDTDTTWLIKDLYYRRDETGNVNLMIEADTPLSILREPGRIAYGYAGTSTVMLSDAPADDQIKTIARNHIGASAGALRDLSAYVAIEANASLGASVAKAFAWRDCLVVCQEIAQASTDAGSYIAFDIVSPTIDTYELRTYAGQRGVDHRIGSGNPVLLSPEMGNLGETELRISYRDMASFVVIGGAGQGTNRTIATVEDTTLEALSPFSVRELFVENTQTIDSATLTSDARAALRMARPRISFSGRLIDTQDTRYGLHWQWGDYVTAQDFGRSFDCRIEAVTVTVHGGDRYETVDAWLRSETYQ